MASRYTKGFRSRKAFDKMYARYKKAYYNRAYMLFKRSQKRLPKFERQRRKPTQEVLRKYMYDDELLNKRKFASEYKDVKRQLREQDSSSDPIQYIVSSQAYEFSREQYLGFKKAISNPEFKDTTGLDLEDVSMIEFRSGAWRNQEFFDAVKEYYYYAKTKGEAMGLSGKELWMYARSQASQLYFGSE